MLDAYIIERIRHREAREQEDSRIPLRIEQTREPMPHPYEEEPVKDPERGVVEVDFSV